MFQAKTKIDDRMTIKRVACDVLKATSAAAASCENAQDNALVEIESASGLVGWGEVESNPWVIKALIEAPGTNSFNQPLAHRLAGRTFTHPTEAWDFLYEKTLITGRRGAGICALGAVDMALWDLLGKVCGQPVWRLLAKTSLRVPTAPAITRDRPWPSIR